MPPNRNNTRLEQNQLDNEQQQQQPDQDHLDDDYDDVQNLMENYCDDEEDEEDEEDEYADMPSLICGTCDKIYSKGGALWEAEHPSINMCQCENAAHNCTAASKNNLEHYDENGHVICYRSILGYEHDCPIYSDWVKCIPDTLFQ